jgi:hypothetical protein
MSLLEASLKDDVWNKQFKFISRVGRKLDYKRSIYRATQQYDPYVYDAIKYFDREHGTQWLQRSIGKTRVPGGDAKIMDRIAAYDKPKYEVPDKFAPYVEEALNELESKLRLNEKVNPKWIYDVDVVPNTTSGYPLFQKKRDVREQIFRDARFRFHLMKRKSMTEMGVPFTVPATRGASRPAEEEKTRLVWVYPAEMLICEGVFAQPLIDHIYQDSQLAEILLVGRDGLKKHQQLVSFLNDEEEVIGVGADFSGFDTTRCVTLIERIFSMLKRKLNHGTYEGKDGDIQTGGTGVKLRSEKAFDGVKDYFIHTPMILPNGRIIRKHIGVPSGSHFTNIIDSFLNWVFIRAFLLYTRIRARVLKVNGDDSAIVINADHKKTVLERMKTFFLECFDMILHVEKSVIAEKPSEMHISGTEWHNFVPTRQTENWFELVLNPKSYVKNPGEGFQRMLGVGICGAFTDPTYCAVFNFYQRGWNCKSDVQKLDWTKYRWLEQMFGEVELPIFFKSGRTKLNYMIRLSG